MKFLEDLWLNYHLTSVVCGWLTAQILKVFTGVFREREFSIRAMIFGNGGMPSSHTASVAALATAIAVTESFRSVAFAIAALLCVIVMNDAMGVRRETGKHSQILNQLFAKPVEGEEKTDKAKLFREFIGHSPLQVFCGMLVGIAVALLISLIPMFGIYG